MGRSIAKCRKRNKRAQSIKSSWINRKATQNANVSNIFDDVDTSMQSTSPNLSIQHDDGAATSNVVNYTSCSSDVNNHGELMEVDALIKVNPRWCNKTYTSKKKMCETASTSFSTTGIMASKEYNDIVNYPLDIEMIPPDLPSIVGNRIVELGYVLQWSMELQYNHSKICTCGKLYIYKEKRRNKGLVSTIVFKCTMCPRIYEYDTENPNKTVSTINYGAVWGTLATGSSYTHMEEFLSCMDIPCMSDNIFYDIENDVGKEWRSSLWRSMEAAGLRERMNALEKGQVCPDGMPWITVYVDGSWSKRSYGSNFNSLSGMVGIIGRHTGELLFIGVKNKFCCICTRAEHKNEQPKDHSCYKNWNESAPAMESALAVEGFSMSEEMHNIRYIQFIADGDASVFAKIKEKVPYGHYVRKIECTNHALKNYGKNLRKIKSDTHIEAKGRRMLTIQKIILLTKRAKCSIYEHSKKESRDINLFRSDLRNNVHHVFGDHSKCRDETCNSVGDQSENKIPDLKDNRIYDHLTGATNLLLRKAHLLIENENNNRAEQLMNIVARFNMGKRLNLVQRGSYERRVHLSGLRYNKSFKWHLSPWKNRTGRSPGSHLKKFINKQSAKRDNKSCKKTLFVETPQHKVRTQQVPNTDYGVNVDEPEEEEDLNFIAMEVEALVQELQVSGEDLVSVERNSVGQFGNQIYERYREKRLTASLFGRVIKRRPYTSCHSMVKACLQPTPFHSDATEYGITKEPVAIKLFESEKKVKVQKSGFWIHEDYGFLGASPDGIVGENAIVEVKCLYVPNEQTSTLAELIKKKKSTICLSINKDKMALKRQHSYYYQVQGQLNICRKEKCYFIVYVNDKIPLFVEEIIRDIKFWEDKMLPVLKQFYMQCIGPEIIRGNLKKGKKCIDPPYIQEAISKRKK